LNAMNTKQRGVVILENMIAIMIFSLGLLGIVGLLANSMKNSAGAAYRNDASMLANQVIGQMWAGEKTNAKLKEKFESPSGTAYTTWKASVGRSLPGVDANPPTIVIAANNTVTVTVLWQAPGEAAAHRHAVVALINN
jgi:type IV pilus assembly protein PilV